MLQKLQKRKQEQNGFTIIEVLIVLAIAGLILLIVFLAVPALERNAHNTSIKNDVAGILGAMNEYENNNNGTVATVVGMSTTGNPTVYVGNTQAICTSTPADNCATAKLGYITAVNSPTSTITTTVPAIGTVDLFTTAVCNGNTPTATGATARNYVAFYQLEGGAIECQAS
jgi:prepilin-type N-terminal cleavage/methylation domain-containing protein